jgi:serine/threonine-protein kinase
VEPRAAPPKTEPSDRGHRTEIEDIVTAPTIDMSPSIPVSVRYDTSSDPPPGGERSLPPSEIMSRRRRRSRAWIFALVVLCGTGVAVVMLRPTGDEPTVIPSAAVTTASPTLAPSDRAPPNRPDTPAGMVRLEGGEFALGSTSAAVAEAVLQCRAEPQTVVDRGEDQCAQIERESPARRVVVSPFFIDRDEVDNAHYVAFLRQLDVRIQVHARGKIVFAGDDALVKADIGLSGIEHAADGVTTIAERADQPVSYVTWEGAQRYCARLGKRLPTEAEWALAARGTEARRYAWGDEAPACGRQVFARAPGLACAASGAGPTAVAVPGDVTPEGVRGLGSNVREWVMDTFVGPFAPCDPPCVDPGRDDERGGGPNRVIRGCGWLDVALMCRAARRGSNDHGYADPQVGFRCAMSVAAGRDVE